MILFKGKDPVAAADVHPLVRTFMPFDVTGDDGETLASLSGQELSMERSAARAAGYYLRAAHEGPTRHGVLLMWLAIDAVAAERRTQKQAVASALSEVGADLTWLGLELGPLVGVRGRIAHGKLHEPVVLRQAYYDSEAIARALIRHAAGIEGGWPAMPNQTAFRLPLGAELGEQAGRWQEEWHEDELPAIDDDPQPAGLPRVDAVLGGHADWVVVVGGDEDGRERLRFWAMVAVRQINVEVARLAIDIDDAGDLPDGVAIRANRDRILIAPAMAAPADEAAEIALAYEVCRCLGQILAMEVGIERDGFGELLIELAGAWAAYRAWVVEQEMPVDVMPGAAPLREVDWGGLGECVGIALAGDDAAAARIDEWLDDQTVDAGLRRAVANAMERLESVDRFDGILDFLELVAEVGFWSGRGKGSRPT